MGKAKLLSQKGPRREYGRHAGNRQPKQRILIACDGEKTETIYFKRLREELRQSVVIEVITPKGGDCAITVQFAIDAGGDWDQRWCVFDVEAPSNVGHALEMAKRARQKGIQVAASNPAFEYWLLLHFVCTTRPFPNAQAVIDELKEHLPDYEKNLNVYPRIKDSTQVAITHATKVLDDHKRTTNHEFPNPSTRVHELVLELHRLRHNPGDSPPRRTSNTLFPPSV